MPRKMVNILYKTKIFIIKRHNHLDPKINKRPWSEIEENLIFEAHK